MCTQRFAGVDFITSQDRLRRARVYKFSPYITRPLTKIVSHSDADEIQEEARGVYTSRFQRWSQTTDIPFTFPFMPDATFENDDPQSVLLTELQKHPFVALERRIRTIHSAPMICRKD